MVKLSVIVPVYNRPEELKEFLDSLTIQHFKAATEVIVVDDGSTLPCEAAADQYRGQLNIRYIRQENAGPAAARNHGAREAQGEYLFFFDSDCTLPSDFFDHISRHVRRERQDCFGTPDQAHTFFSPIQKAISYSMTSLFTTGGIRGDSRGKLDVFYPRSYSMGIRREVFDAVGGFSPMRYGEDIDLSLKVKEAGYKLTLIDTTFVYHKRRSTFRSFFKQTFCSGTARIDLALRHRGSLKLVHVLPSAAVLILLALVALAVSASPLFLLPVAVYALLLASDSWLRFRDLWVAALSVVAGAAQICGYGLGFLYNAWERLVLRRKDTVAFRETLYE